MFHRYQIGDVVNKNIDLIYNQTNFVDEVNNMAQVKENCKHLKYVVIPDANKELTQEYPNFIMMDFIDGIKINQVEEEDKRSYAKQIIKFGFVTSVVHGITHGDLHSGNILFIKDSTTEKYKHKIGIIDFGIIYNIDFSYKKVLFEIMNDLFQCPPIETAEKLLNSELIDPKNIKNILAINEYNNLLEFTRDIIETTIDCSQRENQIQIYKFIIKFKEYLNKKEIASIGVRPSDEFIKTQFILSMSYGVTLNLCGDEFIVIVDEVINELFHVNLMI
jgi:hypothetical protein